MLVDINVHDMYDEIMRSKAFIVVILFLCILIIDGYLLILPPGAYLTQACKIPRKKIDESSRYEARSFILEQNPVSEIECNEGLMFGYSALMNELLSAPQEIPKQILWPDLSSVEESVLANWLWGHAYQRSLDFIRSDPTIRDLLGAIYEIRLVKGANEIREQHSSTYMVFTYQIMGEKNNAVLNLASRMFFYECPLELFDSRMVDMSPPIFQGEILIPGEEPEDLHFDTYQAPINTVSDLLVALRARHLFVDRYCRLTGQ